MKTKKHEVVFFDAGGTLFRPYPSIGAVYAQVAARHGVIVDPNQVDHVFHKKWHERNGMVTLAGLSSEKIEREWWYGLVRDVFGNLGEFDDFDAFFHELYDMFGKADCWRLFDDTLPTLNALKGAGYRLAIISNWDQRLFSIVEQLGLADYFEHVSASSVVGSAKPSARIFQFALQAMKAQPDACVHVGDSLEDDYHGATRAGLTAFLIDRHRKYNDARTVERLTDLIQHV